MRGVTLIAQMALLICLATVSAQKKDFKIVCYYANWSQYRGSPYLYFPRDIDANLCTHIMYAFARIQGTNVLPIEWNDESTAWRTGHYAQVMALKKINPNLKILLALGGWNHGSRPFTEMLETDSKMYSFIESTIDFLRKHSFDGIDIDWEYPGSREGSNPATDKQRFADLLRAMRAAFIADANSNNMPERFMLTAALPAGKETIDVGYDFQAIGEYLDFLNVMSYDLHGQWDDYVGVNAPLYSRAEETGTDLYLNQDFVMNYYLNNGVPREKLIMGLATFGRSFTLQNSQFHDVGDTAVRGGTKGRYTRETGYLSYYEICEHINHPDPSQRWTREWNQQQFSPYAYWQDQWVGYDDVESTTIKAQYIVNNNFGGAMVWELASDDFKNTACGEGFYPLVRSVKNVFENRDTQTLPTITTTPPTVPTTTPTTRTTPTTTRTTRTVVTTRTTPQTTTPRTTLRTTTMVATRSSTQQSTTRKITTRTPPIWWWTTTPKSTTRKITTQTPPIWWWTTTPKSTTRKITTQTPPIWWRTTTPKSTTRTTATRYPTYRPTGKISKPRFNAQVQNFDELCTAPGMLIPYNPDCSKYVQCVYVNSVKPVWFVMSCQDDLHFSAINLWCDFAENVADCPQPLTTSTIPPSTSQELPQTSVWQDPARPRTSTRSETSWSTDLTTITPVISAVTSSASTQTLIFTRYDTTPQNFDTLCTAPGDLLPYNPDCAKFVQCVHVNTKNVDWYLMECQTGLFFNAANLWCDFPVNVPDCPTPPTTTTQNTPPLALAGGGRGGNPVVSTTQKITTAVYRKNQPRLGSNQNVQEICAPGNLIVENNQDCSTFVACVFWKVHYVMSCPAGLYYNIDGFCDWPQNVPECNY